MIYAVVDMGANTIRLSIYTVENGIARQLMNKKETAGLFTYVENGALSKAGMDRACHVLEIFQDVLDNLEITSLYVFATASLRNISNTQETVNFIRERTGIGVDVLSGEEEARLDFVGAMRVAGIQDGILIDIGGGSTELVEFQEGTIIKASSIPLGALSLYLKHVDGLFPANKQSKEIHKDVMQELQKLGPLNKAGHKILYGIGGTIRTTAKLNNRLYNLPQGNREIPAEHLEAILQRFGMSEKQVLRTILQTAPERIHTLLPGIIILKTVANCCDSDIILANSFSIREGYLYDKVLEGSKHC